MSHGEVRQRQLRDPLTDRERQITELYANGMRYKEIGRKLQLAPSTIRTRLSTIYLKFDVSTKTGLSSVLQGRETSIEGPRAGTAQLKPHL
jgi:DNA-binding CsgD family transcriptional regulator